MTWLFVLIAVIVIAALVMGVRGWRELGSAAEESEALMKELDKQ